MMYVSVYPVAMSIRRTNVYEEKSLGLYLPELDEENESFLGLSTSVYVLIIATHIRQQLGFDLWYIFLGVFLICIIESSQIGNSNDYVSHLCRITSL
jgi:Trk-type K+ transport system membrane component